MTLHELLVRTRELLPPDVVVTDEQLVRFINIGYSQVASATMCIRVPYQVAVADYVIEFPSYIIGIITAKWSDGSNSADVTPIYWSEAINFLGNGIYNPPTGTPRYLVVFSAQRCHLYPKPSINGYLEGIAVVLPHPDGVIRPLTDMGAEPQFLLSEHDALAYFAAATALLPYGHHTNLQNSLMETFYNKLLRIKEAADDFTMRPAMMYPPQFIGRPIITGYIP